MNLNRIPHLYHNTIYSKALFEMVTKKHDDARVIYSILGNFNDLDKCYGYLLDLHGQNVGVLREARSDDAYRRVLKFEEASTMLIGSPEDIRNLIGLYFNMMPSEINVEEGSGKIYVRVPQGIDVEEVKTRLSKIKGAGVGYIVDNEIYIEDYRLTELATMKLSDIAKIKLARR